MRPTSHATPGTSLPCRVERNVDVTLAMLDDHKAHATYFTLGWIAERYPHLVRRIVEQGHELASHGYAHLRATDQSREEFRQDITRAKALLEDIGGVAVKGYRAPSFSIGRGNLWALECLREAGYRYSSSVYPIRHDHYGMPDAPRFAFYPDGGNGLLELPVTTVRLFNRNLPAGGGGYFRLLPYRVSRWCLKRVNTVDRQPCIFYFHPWEIDPGQPRQTRHQPEDPLPALRQPLLDGAADSRCSARIFIGIGWTAYSSEANDEPARV